MSIDMTTLIPKTDYKRTGVLAGIVAAHAAVIVLFMSSPALQPKPKDELPIQPPVPLQMAMMELMQTPAPIAASPPPAGQPIAKPHAIPTPPAAAPAKPQSKPVATPPVAMPQSVPKTQSTPAAQTPISNQAVATSEKGITDSASPVATANPSSRPASTSGATASHATASNSSSGVSGSSNSSSPPRFGAAYLNNPAPKYPTMAKRLGEEGRVLLRVLVSPDGLAKNVRLHSSSGSSLLDESAIKAVKRWRFVPAKQGDNSVEAWVQVPIVFKLD